MPVIKIGISKELDQLRKEFEEVMDELFRVPFGSRTMGWMPAIDIYEDTTHIYIVADLAGVDSNSLELLLEGQYLRVSGNRRPPITIRKKRFFQMEVEYGPFERVIRIPLPIDKSEIKAKMENGLLLVQFLKKEGSKVSISVK